MFKKYIEYLKDNPEGYWFKAKWYGWGWTPARWEGWVITFVYVALLILSGLTIDENSSNREVAFTFFIPVGILTALFIRIAYKKGEPPHWRWGYPEKGKEENTDFKTKN